jgi:hypothetical protein
MVPLARVSYLLGIVGLLGILVAASATGGEKDTRAPAADPVVNDKPFHDRLLKIARYYPAYGRIDDEFRWAPWLCREPLPGRPTPSRSKDEGTHGQKLYSLFARDRDAYLTGASASGQVIVKESWVPEVLPGKPKIALFTPGQPIKEAVGKVPEDLAPPRRALSGGGFDHFVPYVEKEGKWYRAARRANLFVMMKLDPKTPGTDEGWVYGTVTADGKTVTSAGRVASCMKCHEPKKDRLFGIGAEKAPR